MGVASGGRCPFFYWLESGIMARMVPALTPELIRSHVDDCKVVDGELRAVAWRAGERPRISPLSVSAKRKMAYAAGVPHASSGLDGAWDDGLDADRVILMPFTDESIDSYRTIMDTAGWDLARHDANPVVLAQHSSDFYWHGKAEAGLPIGLSLLKEKAKLTGVDGVKRNGLVMHALISRSDISEMADLHYRNWMGGRIRGSSVGFLPRGGHRATVEDIKKFKMPEDTEVGRVFVFDDMELFENSMVTLPANSSTTRSAVVANIAELGKRGILTMAEAESLWGADAMFGMAAELFPDVHIEQDGVIEAAAQACLEAPRTVESGLAALQARVEELETEIRSLHNEAERRTDAESAQARAARAEAIEGLKSDLVKCASNLGRVLGTS